jgi:hypothetical protein
VITDYAGYPRFNPAVVKVSVVARDEDGAEFVVKRKTRIDGAGIRPGGERVEAGASVLGSIALDLS